MAELKTENKLELFKFANNIRSLMYKDVESQNKIINKCVKNISDTTEQKKDPSLTTWNGTFDTHVTTCWNGLIKKMKSDPVWNDITNWQYGSKPLLDFLNEHEDTMKITNTKNGVRDISRKFSEIFKLLNDHFDEVAFKSLASVLGYDTTGLPDVSAIAQAKTALGDGTATTAGIKNTYTEVITALGSGTTTADTSYDALQSFANKLISFQRMVDRGQEDLLKSKLPLYLSEDAKFALLKTALSVCVTALESTGTATTKITALETFNNKFKVDSTVSGTIGLTATTGGSDTGLKALNIFTVGTAKTLLDVLNVGGAIYADIATAKTALGTGIDETAGIKATYTDIITALGSGTITADTSYVALQSFINRLYSLHRLADGNCDELLKLKLPVALRDATEFAAFKTALNACIVVLDKVGHATTNDADNAQILTKLKAIKLFNEEFKTTGVELEWDATNHIVDACTARAGTIALDANGTGLKTLNDYSDEISQELHTFLSGDTGYTVTTAKTALGTGVAETATLYASYNPVIAALGINKVGTPDADSSYTALKSFIEKLYSLHRLNDVELEKALPISLQNTAKFTAFKAALKICITALDESKSAVDKLTALNTFNTKFVGTTVEATHEIAIGTNYGLRLLNETSPEVYTVLGLASKAAVQTALGDGMGATGVIQTNYALVLQALMGLTATKVPAETADENYNLLNEFVQKLYSLRYMDGVALKAALPVALRGATEFAAFEIALKTCTDVLRAPTLAEDADAVTGYVQPSDKLDAIVTFNTTLKAAGIVLAGGLKALNEVSTPLHAILSLSTETGLTEATAKTLLGDGAVIGTAVGGGSVLAEVFAQYKPVLSALIGLSGNPSVADADGYYTLLESFIHKLYALNRLADSDVKLKAALPEALRTGSISTDNTILYQFKAALTACVTVLQDITKTATEKLTAIVAFNAKFIADPTTSTNIGVVSSYGLKLLNETEQSLYIVLSSAAAGLTQATAKTALGDGIAHTAAQYVAYNKVIVDLGITEGSINDNYTVLQSFITKLYSWQYLNNTAGSDALKAKLPTELQGDTAFAAFKTALNTCVTALQTEATLIGAKLTALETFNNTIIGISVDSTHAGLKLLNDHANGTSQKFVNVLGKDTDTNAKTLLGDGDTAPAGTVEEIAIRTAYNAIMTDLGITPADANAAYTAVQSLLDKLITLQSLVESDVTGAEDELKSKLPGSLREGVVFTAFKTVLETCVVKLRKAITVEDGWGAVVEKLTAIDTFNAAFKVDGAIGLTAETGAATTTGLKLLSDYMTGTYKELYDVLSNKFTDAAAVKDVLGDGTDNTDNNTVKTKYNTLLKDITGETTIVADINGHYDLLQLVERKLYALHHLDNTQLKAKLPSTVGDNDTKFDLFKTAFDGCITAMVAGTSIEAKITAMHAFNDAVIVDAIGLTGGLKTLNELYNIDVDGNVYPVMNIPEITVITTDEQLLSGADQHATITATSDINSIDNIVDPDKKNLEWFYKDADGVIRTAYTNQWQQALKNDVRKAKEDGILQFSIKPGEDGAKELLDTIFNLQYLYKEKYDDAAQKETLRKFFGSESTTTGTSGQFHTWMTYDYAAGYFANAFKTILEHLIQEGEADISFEINAADADPTMTVANAKAIFHEFDDLKDLDIPITLGLNSGDNKSQPQTYVVETVTEEVTQDPEDTGIVASVKWFFNSIWDGMKSGWDWVIGLFGFGSDADSDTSNGLFNSNDDNPYDKDAEDDEDTVEEGFSVDQLMDN